MSTCPHCGKSTGALCNAADGSGCAEVPDDDFAVCGKCGELSRAEGGAFRKLVPADEDDLSPNMKRVIMAVRRKVLEYRARERAARN